MAKQKYRALVGLSYPAGAADLRLCLEKKPHKRKEVEPGEIVNDIPLQSIDWLLEDKRIEEIGEDTCDEEVEDG